MRKKLVLLMALATVVPVFAFGTATAAGNFTCRASVVRVDGEGPLDFLFLEPFVANAQNDPCVADDASVLNRADIGGLANVSLLFAETNTEPNQGATARSGILELVLTLPGFPVIEVDILTSEAGAFCNENGEVEFTSESHVVGLTIDGDTVLDIPPGHVDIPIPGLGTLHLNETTTTPDSVTQQALFLDTILGDVVIAESIADFSGDNVCPRRLPGWMTGGGYVAEPGTRQDHNGEGEVDPGTKAQHSFSIDCFFPTANDSGKKDHLGVHMFDESGRDHANFKLLMLMDAECSDDPELEPSPPRSTFDTMEGSGIGICRQRGQDFPAMVEFRFTDGGEPSNDEADITVSSPAEAAPVLCNQESHGHLDGGNHQAHQRPAQRGGA